MTIKSKVLLVEDTASLSALYKEYLRDLDIELVHVPNGTMALDIMKSDHFDLLLLDINLPDISGIQVLRKMIEGGKMIPTIIISANNAVEKAVEAMKYGARDYIVKPFSRERISITVKNMLLMAKLELDAKKFSGTENR
jgi:DNA-binding NtrC family response regulator